MATAWNGSSDVEHFTYHSRLQWYNIMTTKVFVGTKLFCCAVHLMNEDPCGQSFVQLQSTLLRMRNTRHHYWHGNLQSRPPMAPPSNLNSRWCPRGQLLLPSSECGARQVLPDVYPQQLSRMCWISAFQLVLVIVMTFCQAQYFTMV